MCVRCVYVFRLGDKKFMALDKPTVFGRLGAMAMLYRAQQTHSHIRFPSFVSIIAHKFLPQEQDCFLSYSMALWPRECPYLWLPEKAHTFQMKTSRKYKSSMVWWLVWATHTHTFKSIHMNTWNRILESAFDEVIQRFVNCSQGDIHARTNTHTLPHIHPYKERRDKSDSG